MATKEVKKLLNELINESDRRMPDSDFSRIISLDLPIEVISDEWRAVDLNEIVIFDGIDTIVSKLLDEIRESCFFGQSDVSVNINIEKEICPQLYQFGIHKIAFYSLFENLEQLPVLYKNIATHIRYIFNALQSPGIHRGFLSNVHNGGSHNASLLFPFNREVAFDRSGLHYLVERIPGSHFLRITAEELDHSRLNFRKINHRIVSNIGLIDDFFTIRQVAFTIHSSVLNRCHDHKLNFKDAGLQLSTLIHFLQKARYGSLREITIQWPRQVADEILRGNYEAWFGNVARLLLILSDVTTSGLLLQGKTIATLFNGTTAFVSLTQKNRNLQIDLQEKMVVSVLAEYLAKMEKLDTAIENMEHALNNVHLLLIHHFTAETLAILGAFDKLNAHRVDTLWVKYTGSVPTRYLETILSLPSSVYRFYGLQQVSGKHHKPKFCLSDRYSSIDEFTGLQWWLESGEFEFFPAMQRVAMHLFLDTMMNGEETRIVVAEDGGYLAPLINRHAMEKQTVGDIFELYGYENGFLSDALISKEFGDWISSRFCGSVEHTRNGYDALMAVENEFAGLAFPACSLAVSNFKVNDESVEVAYSCINAIENILNGQGFVLNARRCLVLGSLGAIGIQTMKIFLNRVGEGMLSGIDLKCLNNPPGKWEQVVAPSELSEETLRNVDLIFGVVGHSILNATFFEELIVNTARKSLFLASGSTKRFEFINFLDWTAALLDSKSPMLKGFPLSISSKPIEDPQTSALLGIIFTFKVEMNSEFKRVDIYLLSSGMPVNFQYYGVARETMDSVMTEFVSLVNVISKASENKLPAKLLALDYSIDLEGRLL